MTTNARDESLTDMHEDLYWLARNVSEWDSGYFPDGCIFIRDDEKGKRRDYCSSDTVNGNEFTCAAGDRHTVFHRKEWQDARQQLGLDPTGIADPDEEECLQLAYERMGDESVKVSIDELQDNVNKPKHYQLRDGYEVYDLRQDLAAKAANGGATYDQYSDWDRAIEYIVRMWGKNRLEDAKKGRWYLDKLIGKLEDQG